MGKLEILSEINRLVSSGLKKAAIDLLTEYLEKKPESSFAHKTLGQIYLKSGQPRKAVFHLKKSLELGRKQESLVETRTYDPHDFNDDDWDYISSESLNSTEQEYEFEDEGAIEPSDDKCLSSGRNQDGNNSELPEQYGSEIKERDNAEFQVSPAVENQFDGAHQAAADNTLTNSLDSEPVDESIPPYASNPESEYDEQVIDIKEDVYHETWPEVQDFRKTNSDSEAFDIAPDSESDEFDELVDFDNDEEFNGISANDEELEEVWDDSENIDELDDLDELEVSALDDDLDYVDSTAVTELQLPSDGRLSREQRALQVATEVISGTDWDYKHVTLLQEIFSIRGWAATRVVIKKLIEEGATPDEIALAREIRTLWKETPKYWITFHKLTPRAVDTVTDDAYKQMSWSESMRLIRCFPNTPDIEEIYHFIEETYDLWYQTSNLRRDFKAFFKFLKYRNGSMKITLPGDYPFCFTEPEESGYDDEYDFLHYSHSEQYRELELMGLSPERFVQIPPQEISKKEDMEYV